MSAPVAPSSPIAVSSPQADRTGEPAATHEDKRDRCAAGGIEGADDLLQQRHGTFDEIVKPRRRDRQVFGEGGIAEPSGDLDRKSVV
jgi:hypothetical protein